MRDDAQSAISAAIDRRVRARYAAIETACERALQGGTHGVLVIEEPGGGTYVGPHPAVPYGRMVEFRGTRQQFLDLDWSRLTG